MAHKPMYACSSYCHNRMLALCQRLCAAIHVHCAGALQPERTNLAARTTRDVPRCHTARSNGLRLQ